MPLSDALKVSNEEQIRQVFELYTEIKAIAAELKALAGIVKTQADGSQRNAEDVANRVAGLHVTEGRVAQLAADAFSSKVDSHNAAIKAENSVKRLE